MMKEKSKKIGRFLKAPFPWTGGKTKQINQMRSLFPAPTSKTKRYIEPFVGAGTILLHQLETNPTLEFIATDANDALINFWKCLQKNVQLLIQTFSQASFKHFNDKDRAVRIKYFNVVKNAFNQILEKRLQQKHSKLDYVWAAQFIYLMKTCYSNTWQVNRNTGLFTGAIGNLRKELFNKEQFLAIAKILNERRIRFSHADCFNIIKNARPHDILYIDPPYSETAMTYIKTQNSPSTFQKSLADAVEQKRKEQVTVIMSNSDTATVKKLYPLSKWRHKRVDVTQRLNRRSDKQNHELFILSR